MLRSTRARRDAHAAARVALRVEVDEQRAPLGRGHARREVDGRGRLADAALLVDDGDHARAALVAPRGALRPASHARAVLSSPLHVRGGRNRRRFLWATSSRSTLSADVGQHGRERARVIGCDRSSASARKRTTTTSRWTPSSGASGLERSRSPAPAHEPDRAPRPVVDLAIVDPAAWCRRAALDRAVASTVHEATRRSRRASCVRASS